MTWAIVRDNLFMGRHRLTPTPMKPRQRLLNSALLLLLWMMSLSACATTHTRQDPTARGYLRLEVKPESAELLINEQYQGYIKGWAQQIVPVRPGLVQVELRARGYIAQRFDLQIAKDEEVTLSLSLERDLEEEDPTATEDADAAPKAKLSID